MFVQQNGSTTPTSLSKRKRTENGESDGISVNGGIDYRIAFWTKCCTYIYKMPTTTVHKRKSTDINGLTS